MQPIEPTLADVVAVVTQCSQTLATISAQVGYIYTWGIVVIGFMLCYLALRWCGVMREVLVLLLAFLSNHLYAQSPNPVPTLMIDSNPQSIYSQAGHAIMIQQQNPNFYWGIMYTLNGQPPDEAQYQAGNAWIWQGAFADEAIGQRTFMARSFHYHSSTQTFEFADNLVEFTYQNDYPQLLLNPTQAIYEQGSTIDIVQGTIPAGASVAYTLDGSNPVVNGLPWLGPLELNAVGVYTLRVVGMNQFGQTYDIPHVYEVVDTTIPLEVSHPNGVIEPGQTFSIFSPSSNLFEVRLNNGQWQQLNGITYQTTPNDGDVIEFRYPGHDVESVTIDVVQPTAHTPIISPDGQTGSGGPNVTVVISSDQPDATIYYSLDEGNTWQEYTQPLFIVIENTFQRVFAKATRNGGALESQTNFELYEGNENYYVDFDPPPGTYANWDGYVSILENGPGGNPNYEIWYTLGTGVPSTQYQRGSGRIYLGTPGTEGQTPPSSGTITVAYKNPADGSWSRDVVGSYSRAESQWQNQTPGTFTEPIQQGPYYDGVKLISATGVSDPNALHYRWIGAGNVNAFGAYTPDDPGPGGQYRVTVDGYEALVIDGWVYPTSYYLTSGGNLSDQFDNQAKPGSQTIDGQTKTNQEWAEYEARTGRYSSTDYFCQQPPVAADQPITIVAYQPNTLVGTGNSRKWKVVATYTYDRYKGTYVGPQCGQTPGCIAGGEVLSVKKCPDSDNDGIPNALETYLGLDPDSPLSEMVDDDQDNVPDRWELNYLACSMNEPCQCTSTDVQTAWVATHNGQTLIQVLTNTVRPRSYYDQDQDGYLDAAIVSCTQTNPVTDHCCNCCCDECEAARYSWTSPSVTAAQRPSLPANFTRDYTSSIQTPSVSVPHKQPYVFSPNYRELVLPFSLVASGGHVNIHETFGVDFKEVRASFGDQNIFDLFELGRVAFRGCMMWLICAGFASNALKRVFETFA